MGMEQIHFRFSLKLERLPTGTDVSIHTNPHTFARTCVSDCKIDDAASKIGVLSEYMSSLV